MRYRICCDPYFLNVRPETCCSLHPDSTPGSELHPPAACMSAGPGLCGSFVPSAHFRGKMRQDSPRSPAYGRSSDVPDRNTHTRHCTGHHGIGSDAYALTVRGLAAYDLAESDLAAYDLTACASAAYPDSGLLVFSLPAWDLQQAPGRS